MYNCDTWDIKFVLLEPDESKSHNHVTWGIKSTIKLLKKEVSTQWELATHVVELVEQYSSSDLAEHTFWGGKISF